MAESPFSFSADPFAQTPTQRSADGRACFLALRQQFQQPLAMTAQEAANALSGPLAQRPTSLGDFLRWHERHQACRTEQRVRVLAHHDLKRATAILEHALRQGGVRLVGNDGRAVFILLEHHHDVHAPSRPLRLVAGFTDRAKAEAHWMLWCDQTVPRAARTAVMAGDRSLRDLLDSWCETWEEMASDELAGEFGVSHETLMGYVDGQRMPSHATADVLAHVLCVESDDIVAACLRSQADAGRHGKKSLAAWRILRGMSLDELSGAAAVSIPSLRKYEAGAIPHHKQAKPRLAKALGVGVRQIAWSETGDQDCGPIQRPDDAPDRLAG